MKNEHVEPPPSAVLLRQDVIREAAGKIHDPVLSQGPGNEDLHKDL